MQTIYNRTPQSNYAAENGTHYSPKPSLNLSFGLTFLASKTPSCRAYFKVS
jgi:hypothetical protein